MQSACKLVTNTFVYRVRGRSELISHCSGLFCLFFFFNYFFGNYRQAVLKHNQSPFKSTPSASRTREGIPALPTVGCAGRALLAPCWVSSALPLCPLEVVFLCLYWRSSTLKSTLSPISGPQVVPEPPMLCPHGAALCAPVLAVSAPCATDGHLLCHDEHWAQDSPSLLKELKIHRGSPA